MKLERIIPVIGNYLPNSSNINDDKTLNNNKSKQSLKLSPSLSPTNEARRQSLKPIGLKKRSLSAPYYVPDIDISSSEYNSTLTTSVHAYFHGYLSLYNHNFSIPPCFIWMKSLQFDEYDDRQFGRKKKIKITVLGDVGVGKSTLIHRYLRDEFTPNYTPTIADCYTNTMILTLEDDSNLYKPNNKNVPLSSPKLTNKRKSKECVVFDFDITKIEQEILDTAGGDVIGMAGSIDEWIENGQIFLLCFDISRGMTLQYLKSYIIPRIQQHFETKTKLRSTDYTMDKSNHIGPCSLILVGCKVDLREELSTKTPISSWGRRKASSIYKSEADKHDTTSMKKEIRENYNNAMQLAYDMKIPYIETSAKTSTNIKFLFRQCIFEHWIQKQTNCINWFL